MFEITMTGRLGHNNDYFDRTCPNCGGMYDSRVTAVCTKCGGSLSFITTSKGKPMGISEGTIYPIQRKEHQDQDEKAIAKRKNGMKPIYRFVIFSFADDQGNLAPPGVHQYLTKGKQVLIRTQHQPVPSWFKTKGDEVRVELRIMVFHHMGDKIELLGDKQSGELNDVPAPANTLTAYGAQPGTNVKVETPQPLDIQTLMQMKPQIDMLHAILNGQTTQAASAAVSPDDQTAEPVMPDDDIPF